MEKNPGSVEPKKYSDHECHGENGSCPFQNEVLPAIKSSCNVKRFNQALKIAREKVNTLKCPKLIAVFCSVSMKLNKPKAVLSFIEEQVPTDLCIEIIDNFIDQNLSSFGIQKYLPKFLNLLLNATVVRLLMAQDVHSLKLSKYLHLWIVRNIHSDNFEKMFKKLIGLSVTNNYLFVMFDTLKNFKSGPNSYLILKWELFIRAITYDLNDYEFMKFNPECNENDLVDEEKNMSDRYIQLAELCYYNIPVQSECLLTAYSLNPTRKIYNIIKRYSTAINELKSLKQSKIPKKTCCTNLQVNTLCDTCGDLITNESLLLLNDNNRNIISDECTEQIFSGKVFYFDGNVNSEDEDTIQQLATDLITILTAPRNKLITWELEWETLNKNLLRLLKPQNKINLVKQYMSDANSKLKFLKQTIDYNKFRHLPEPQLPGIEKGYEAYLDSEYETDDEVGNNTKKLQTNSTVFPTTSESTVREINETRRELFNVEFSSLDTHELSVLDVIDNLKVTSPNRSKTNVSLDNVVSQSSDIIPSGSHQSVPPPTNQSITNASRSDNVFLSPRPRDVMHDVYDRPRNDFNFSYSPIRPYYNIDADMDDQPEDLTLPKLSNNTNNLSPYSPPIPAVNRHIENNAQDIQQILLMEKSTNLIPHDQPTLPEIVQISSSTDSQLNYEVQKSSHIKSNYMYGGSTQPTTHDPFDLDRDNSSDSFFNELISASNQVNNFNSHYLNDNRLTGDKNDHDLDMFPALNKSVNISNVVSDSIETIIDSSNMHVSNNIPILVNSPNESESSDDDVQILDDDPPVLPRNINCDIRTHIPALESSSTDKGVSECEAVTKQHDVISLLETEPINRSHVTPDSTELIKKFNYTFQNSDCELIIIDLVSDESNDSVQLQDNTNLKSTDIEPICDLSDKEPKNDFEHGEQVISPNLENCSINDAKDDVCENVNPVLQVCTTTLDTKITESEEICSKIDDTIHETPNSPIKNVVSDVIPEKYVEPAIVPFEDESTPTKNSDEEHFYPDTLGIDTIDVRPDVINAWSPVAVAKPEEITEVISFDATYNYDSDYSLDFDDENENDCDLIQEKIAKLLENTILSKDEIVSPELNILTREAENNNNETDENNKSKLTSESSDICNDVNKTGTIGTNHDGIILPDGLGKLKELTIVLKPFIRECCIPLKRLKLNPSDGSKTFKITEVSNGQQYGLGNVIILNDPSFQKRLLPTITLNPFSHSNSYCIKGNSKCQLINLKKRKSSANSYSNRNKRPRTSDADLQNSIRDCDIDSNRKSEEIQFIWATQTIKNYGRPKNKNFHKEGSYLKKYEKRCITPSSLLINSNLYNSTLNKVASKLNGSDISINIKYSDPLKSNTKVYKNRLLFNKVPGLKTYEHLKISRSVRNQSINIIEVFNNKSNSVNNTTTISNGNNGTTSTNSTTNQTVLNTTIPSSSGSVFHHFVQFNHTNKGNNSHNNEFNPDGTSVQQTTQPVIKANQNIVQFLCKTDGKKIQLTPITNQRISHIQINRISNENVTTNSQEVENQTTDTLLPKFIQAFNNRTTTHVPSEPSTIATVARNLPVINKLQIAPTRPVRISMPVIQKSNVTSSSVTSTPTTSRSIIQLPLRQLNQMSQTAGVTTFPRQVLITAAPTRINSTTPVVATITAEEATEAANKSATTTSSNSNNNNNKLLDTSTLEQLREFDMVLEQVKERSISCSSNTKDDLVTVKTTAAPTSVIQKGNLRNVAFIQQKRGANDSPVVVLCGNNTKNLPNKKVVATNTIKSTPAPTTVSQFKTKTDESKLATSECITTPISIIQKPPQKLQEDEQTVQRIYDILAEYAEQLRNSPDLKNKPAPRRRTNPTLNTICTNSSQVSNDNDSSSNSSISTVVPSSQNKRENDSNNITSTVLLISPNDKQVSSDKPSSFKNQQILLSDAALPKATVPNKISTSHTNTQTGLGNTQKFYTNNCIPLNTIKRQQITILSGSKMLTTLPSSNQKTNTTRNDSIIIKPIQSTNSIKSINNNSRSLSNTSSSPIYVLSRNTNNKSNSEMTILNNGSTLHKNTTTHTVTSTTHSATTTNFNNNKMIKESSILEKEIKLQKSLSEECEDLGVDEPSTSDLFPEAGLLLDANTNSPIENTLDDDQHYCSTTTTQLLYNNSKPNIETDISSMNFSNRSSSMTVKQNNNKKRVYGSANWLKCYGNHSTTRKMVKLSNSAATSSPLDTMTTSMDGHIISISHESKSTLKRR